MTNEGDLVVDPYLGVGSALCGAVKHKRRGAGSDIFKEYADIATDRVTRAFDGTLKTRPMGKEVYKPDPNTKVARNYWSEEDQQKLAIK